jgi:CRISPR-associated protein Csx10
MNNYNIRITLNSPVCIAQKRGIGDVIETIDYIPGSTIRGALAMQYIRQYGDYVSQQKQDEFNSIFNSENTRFGNCYIDDAKVIPFTASSCKYYAGFLAGLDQHGVYDNMIQYAMYESCNNHERIHWDIGNRQRI